MCTWSLIWAQMRPKSLISTKSLRKTENRLEQQWNMVVRTKGPIGDLVWSWEVLGRLWHVTCDSELLSAIEWTLDTTLDTRYTQSCNAAECAIVLYPHFLPKIIPLTNNEASISNAITYSYELSNYQSYEAKTGQTNAHLSSFCSWQIPNQRRTRSTEEAQCLSTTDHVERHSHCGWNKVRELSRIMSIRCIIHWN